jgi:hypothetical protein
LYARFTKLASSVVLARRFRETGCFARFLAFENRRFSVSATPPLPSSPANDAAANKPSQNHGWMNTTVSLVVVVAILVVGIVTFNSLRGTYESTVKEDSRADPTNPSIRGDTSR